MRLLWHRLDGLIQTGAAVAQNPLRPVMPITHGAQPAADNASQHAIGSNTMARTLTHWIFRLRQVLGPGARGQRARAAASYSATDSATYYATDFDLAARARRAGL